MTTDPQTDRSRRAAFTVTVTSRPDGGHYFDRDDFFAHVVQWLKAGLRGKHAIAEVTVAGAAPGDRAAVLREAADAIEEAQHRRDDIVNDALGFLDNNTEQQHLAVHRAGRLLRRMADEEQQPETVPPPTVALSETERRMLEYALDLADTEIATDGAEFSDEEEDALADLRRLAAVSSHPEQAKARCGRDIETALGTYPCERDADHRGDCDERTESEIKEQSTVVSRPEIVHACPPDGSGLTPCCGRTPFELPLSDRISSEAPVTCTGAAVAQPGKEEQPAIPCNAVHLRVHHAGHQWEPQPGMDRIPCAGYPAAAPQPGKEA